MKKIVNYRALPVFLVFMIVGILLTTFVNAIFIIPLAIVCGVAIVLCLFIAKIRKYLLRAIMITVALILAITATGIDVYFQSEYQPIKVEKAILSGTVDGLSHFDSEGNLTNDKYIILSNVEYDTEDGVHNTLSGKLHLFGIAERPLKLGDRITYRGDINSIEIDPTSQSDIRSYRNSIKATSLVYSIENVVAGRLNFFDSIKLNTKANLYKNSSDKLGGFIYSMLYGDKSDLNPEIKADFGLSGLSHLFAVSGLHVAMIAIVIIFLLKKLKAKRWLQLVITTVILILYNILCCFSPSVLRATIMIIIAHTASTLGYKNDSISTLSFAAVIILLFRPFYLFDLSFAMSFFAVLGIVCLGKPIASKLSFMPTKLSTPLSLSISVNIGLFPLIIYYFGSLSLLFLLANMIIIPIVSVAYPLIFVANSIALVMPFMGFLITPVSWLFQLVASISQGISMIPFFVLRAEVTVTIIIVWLVLLVFLSDYVVVGQKFKKLLTVILVFVFALSCLFNTIGIFRDKTRLTPAYVDQYSDDSYIHLSHRDKDYLVINGDLSVYGITVLRRYLFTSGVGVDVVIAHELDSDEFANLHFYLKDYGIQTLVTAETREEYRNLWSLEYLNSYTDKNLTINYLSVVDILMTVNDVRILFSKNSQIEHQEPPYGIIYSNGNLLAAINAQSKFVVSNSNTNNQLPLDVIPDHLLTNSFTFTFSNGKIKYSEVDKWN